MSKIVFEDMTVEIYEDKSITQTNYDIQNNMLITKKILSTTTSSSIYDYGDGYSLYLKSDESGTQKLIFPMLAVYSIQDEKKLATIPDTANFSVKRYKDKHFILNIDDPINNEGVVLFNTLYANGDIHQSRLNFTKLEKMEIVNESIVIVNSFEICEKYNIWNIGVYDLSGKIKKQLVDGKYKKEIIFSFKVFMKNNGKKFISVSRIDTLKDKTKHVLNYYLRIRATSQELKEFIIMKKQEKIAKKQAKIDLKEKKKEKKKIEKLKKQGKYIEEKKNSPKKISKDVAVSHIKDESMFTIDDNKKKTEKNIKKEILNSDKSSVKKIKAKKDNIVKSQKSKPTKQKKSQNINSSVKNKKEKTLKKIEKIKKEVKKLENAQFDYKTDNNNEIQNVDNDTDQLDE